MKNFDIPQEEALKLDYSKGGKEFYSKGLKMQRRIFDVAPSSPNSKPKYQELKETKDELLELSQNLKTDESIINFKSAIKKLQLVLDQIDEIRHQSLKDFLEEKPRLKEDTIDIFVRRNIKIKKEIETSKEFLFKMSDLYQEIKK